MTLRFQRLLLILISLIFLTSSILLVLYSSKKNLVFFYTPSEFINSEIHINSTVRIGGFVEKNSLVYQGNNIYEFNITDNNNNLSIIYEGILPDLFREQQGAVVEGKVIKNNVLEASTVFAKHDENYMPETIKKQLIDNQYWKQEYK
tara:strand:+ start:2436 stop:2876 length:441 start_codon:yes stop_codon:yes gene_type:complete